MRVVQGLRQFHASLPCDGSGQSTVEYALVVMAFVAMLLAMALLWHAGRDGMLLERAIRSSSHQLGGADALGSLRDVVLY
ncbi:MAG: hypothetical protein J6D34_01070 [Atopobiaceae bacterium]|nr:hypothetical protein [Atopobiaceae bacterium]